MHVARSGERNKARCPRYFCPRYFRLALTCGNALVRACRFFKVDIYRP